MSEELSCTQRPFPRTLWRVFGRGIPSLARPLSYGNGIFQTVFRHSPPICISLRCLFRRCRSAVAAAYTVSATFAMQDADAPLLSVPNQSLPFATPPIQPPHTAGAFAVAWFMHHFSLPVVQQFGIVFLSHAGSLIAAVLFSRTSRSAPSGSLENTGFS